VRCAKPYDLNRTPCDREHFLFEPTVQVTKTLHRKGHCQFDAGGSHCKTVISIQTAQIVGFARVEPQRTNFVLTWEPHSLAIMANGECRVLH